MTTRQLVLVAALLTIMVQLVLRAWAIYNGWFYGDDFKFLSEAATEPLTLDYLFTRHQQQLMPGGLLVAWLVGQGSAFSWALAASSILIMQAMASVACLLMLRSLFGLRPAIMFPLAFYLFSPMTLGAFMWWAAALNQLPLQIVFFLVITTHVHYLRTSNPRFLAASGALLIVGLLFYVKSVVTIPVLAFLAVAYFTPGDLKTRIVGALRRWWPAWLAYASITGTYLGFYVSTGESPVDGSNQVAYADSVDRQVREAFGPTLVGGPWRWLDPGRADVLADAPDAAITAAWVAITAIVVLTIWRHKSAWLAWLLLVLYLVPTVFLTANGRASIFGPDVGLYVRYLSDVAVVACLALACATMSLRGGSQPLRRRPDSGVVPPPLIAAATGAFLAGSVWSTVGYAQFWHSESPVKRFVTTAERELQSIQSVRIADERLPVDFILEPNMPFDRPSRLLAPLDTRIETARGGTDLSAFSPNGLIGAAVVTPGVTSVTPENQDCGTLIRSETETIELEDTVTEERWWMGVEYFASDAGLVTVDAGDESGAFAIEEGLHTLFFSTTGTYDEVTLTVRTPGVSVCVPEISVGILGTFG